MNAMESEQGSGIPPTIAHMAEQYQAGQPLALHPMCAHRIRSFQIFKHILLGSVACLVFLLIALVVDFFYPYLVLLIQHPTNLSSRILPEEQFIELRGNFVIFLGHIFLGLISLFVFVTMRNIIIQEIPVSFLVCTEGIVEIRPKGVDVTHWNEVSGMLQEFMVGKKKYYKFRRLNRKPLEFSDAFENIEGLAALIRQELQKRDL